MATAESLAEKLLIKRSDNRSRARFCLQRRRHSNLTWKPKALGVRSINFTTRSSPTGIRKSPYIAQAWHSTLSL